MSSPTTMSPASSATNPYIPKTLENQDLERMRFSQNLRKNPADYNKYVNERINDLSSEIFNRKRTAFQKAHIDLARYMDMDHNANFYKSRNSDVNRLTTSMDQNNQRIQDSLERDLAISKRQFEINEWYNYNKLETLFFLQLFFISSLVMVVVLFYQKKGAINNQIAALITGVLCLIVIGTGVYRYFYTQRTRDTRLWHRKNFKTPSRPIAKEDKKCKPESEYIDLNDYIPKSVTQCLDQAAQKMESVSAGGASTVNDWNAHLQKEMSDYQQLGKPPAVASNTGWGVGSAICDNLSGIL